MAGAEGAWVRAVTGSDGRDWLFVDGDSPRVRVDVGGRALTVDLPEDRRGPVRVDLDA